MRRSLPRPQLSPSPPGHRLANSEKSSEQKKEEGRRKKVEDDGSFSTAPFCQTGPQFAQLPLAMASRLSPRSAARTVDRGLSLMLCRLLQGSAGFVGWASEPRIKVTSSSALSAQHRPVSPSRRNCPPGQMQSPIRMAPWPASVLRMLRSTLARKHSLHDPHHHTYRRQRRSLLTLRSTAKNPAAWNAVVFPSGHSTHLHSKFKSSLQVVAGPPNKPLNPTSNS